MLSHLSLTAVGVVNPIQLCQSVRFARFREDNAQWEAKVRQFLKDRKLLTVPDWMKSYRNDPIPVYQASACQHVAILAHQCAQSFSSLIESCVSVNSVEPYSSLSPHHISCHRPFAVVFGTSLVVGLPG
jgi:hypothetical protein